MPKVQSKQSVLILDPVAVNRKIVSKVLSKNNFKTVEVSSLAEATEHLSKSTFKFMITSLELEACKADEIIWEIRKYNSSIPVIVITGDQNPNHILTLFEQGYQNYLLKPIKPKLLQAAVEDILDASLDYLGLCSKLSSFDSFSVPIYFVNHERRIVYANKAFSVLTGIPKKTISKKPLCCDVLHYNLCEDTCVCTEPLETSKVKKIREIVAELPENDLNLFISLIPVKDHDKGPQGLLACMADLSSEASAQSNVQKLYELEKEKSIALEKATKELAELNKNLENKVQRRTAELNRVLSNIDLGIISFSEDGTCGKGYSENTKHIFNVDKVHQESIYKVLSIEEGSESEHNLREWIKVCFMMYGNMEWDDIENISPLQEWTFSEKIIKTRWNPIESNEELVGLLMINSDITEQKFLEEQIQNERKGREKEMATLHNLVNISEEELLSYFKELLEKQNHLEDINKKQSFVEDIGLAYRSAHTIKGTSSLYGFQNIVDSAHELESHLELLRSKKTDLNDEYQSSYEQLFSNLSKAIDEVLSWAERLNIYNKDSLNERKYKVEDTKIHQTIDLLRKIQAGSFDPQKLNLDKEIEYWTHKSTVSCVEYFSRMVPLVENTAHNLDKTVHPLKLDGESVRIAPELAEKLTDPITHIIRNAVDHGIESPEQRKELKKEVYASISLSFKEEDDKLWISIKDDGGGIDGEKVYQKSLENGANVSNTLSFEDKQALIFLPGLSTAEAVSETSGRGVGMDIVKQTIEGLSGQITFNSELGLGTSMNIIVPNDKV